MKSFSVLLMLCLGLSSGQVLAGYNNVHKCDEFGAHYDDPAKWAIGNYDTDLAPGPTIKFCSDAIEAYPGTERFSFQLGRAYYKRGDYQQAFKHLDHAKNKGYAPAYAYLADMYGQGLHVNRDVERAFEYYAIAAKGFPPAAEMLSEYEAEQEELARTSNLDASLLARGQIVEALYHGNFDDLEGQYDMALWYIKKMNENFKEQFLYIDPTCVRLSDTKLNHYVADQQAKLKTGHTQPQLGGVLDDLISGNRSNIDFDNMGKAIFGAFKFAFSGEGMAFQRKVAQVQLDADKDSVTLVQHYSCSNPLVKQFFTNGLAFVRGKPPVTRTGVITARGYKGFSQRCEYYSRRHDFKTVEKTCDCIVGALKTAKINLSQIDAITDNYPSGLMALKKDRQLQKGVASCVLAMQ